MPSAANAKSEKVASSEATDNSPLRQIVTIMEHKIRNLDKRKSKLVSYRDLQKAGKELNSDQKEAVAKYDGVVQTLEFAKDLMKQITAIVSSAEREAKKQAKKDAWVRYATDTNKIREVLLIWDCYTQLANIEIREDFLNGTNGAAKLTEDDLKILDDLYPEITPKHELNEDGQSGFHVQTVKAAEHLYAIIDGKPKEVLGTTYAHIKEIVNTIQNCGYFDKTVETVIENNETHETAEEDQQQVEAEDTNAMPYPTPEVIPTAPAPSVVPAPAYPLCPIPPITLREVEHTFFTQQYLQQRQISEVIGSQNFVFLQDSEIDSPIGTPQPPQIMNQPSPPAPIQTQTFTNQHFVQLPGGRVPEMAPMPMPPQTHYSPHPEHAMYPGVHPIPAPMPHQQQLTHSHNLPQPQPQMQPILQPHPQTVLIEQPPPQPEERKTPTPIQDKNVDDWKENRSPEQEEGGERKTQGQGDGQNRFRRFGRGGRGSNGYRSRGSYQIRHYDGYHNKHKDMYHSRNNDYYANGDAGDNHLKTNENSGRGRNAMHSTYNDNQSYQGGFKGRGRGGPRGAARGAPRTPRPQQYSRKPDSAE